MEKNFLFYAAHLYPEVGRLFSFFDSGKKEAAENAQNRALSIIENILTSSDLKPAGREEWSVIRNFLLGFDKLNKEEREIVEKYASPFSYKFMTQYQYA